MRVSDTYDAVAIDQLEGLDLYLSKLTPEEMADLGFSFKSIVRKVEDTFKKVHAPILNTRVGKAIRRIQADVVAHVRKVFTKKWFMKAAPYLAIAAQILNFVVPGLGVLVSLAITASSTALSMVEAKKAQKAVAKAEAAANKEVAADQAAADVEANKALDDAYSKAGLYFTTTYGMTDIKWAALPVEGKNKFLNIVIYDQHAKAMQDMGVTRDAFQEMGVGEQQEALSKMAEKLPQAQAAQAAGTAPPPPTVKDTVQIPVDAEGKAIGPVPSIAALTGNAWYQDPLILGGGAIALILGVAIVAKLRRA
jgi:hypothetical protein